MSPIHITEDCGCCSNTYYDLSPVERKLLIELLNCLINEDIPKKIQHKFSGTYSRQMILLLIKELEEK